MSSNIRRTPAVNREALRSQREARESAINLAGRKNLEAFRQERRDRATQKIAENRLKVGLNSKLCPTCGEIKRSNVFCPTCSTG